MGYYTRFNGEIRITPPLNWAEIQDSPFYEDGEGIDKDVRTRATFGGWRSTTVRPSRSERW